MDRSRSGVAVARPSAARRRAPVRMTEALEGRTMLAAQWPGADLGPIPAAAQAGVSGTVYDDANANGSFDPGGGEFGLGGVIVYHDANNNGVFDSGIADRFAPAIDLPVDIPDPGIAVSRIEVADLPGVVRDVNVTVWIQHPYTFDLEVTLISPSGREVTLFDNVGEEDFFGRSEDFSGTVLDDEVGARIQDGEPPFAGRYQPEQLLSIMDGETMNGTWTLRLRDWVPVDEGMLIDWGLTFDTGEGEPNAISEGDGAYAFPDLAPGDYRFRQVLLENYRQTQPTANAAYVLTLAEGQQVTGRNFGQATGVPASTVAGRHVFYNRSAFDGFDPAANEQDDAAIATDKAPLLSGQGATFANYTSYARGINGVMVDVVNLPAGAGPTADDFAFKAGNGGDASAWPDLLVVPEISIRRGAGAGGSDRITLTWPDRSIVRQWLQVTVNATANTGLVNPDVFTFGNLPGETGNPAGPARVDAADVLAVRAALGATGQPVDNPLDFNRDRRVNSSDYATARANAGRSLELPTAAGAAAAGVFSEIPIANRRTSYRPVRVWNEATAVLF